MNGARVERIRRAVDADEARGLLERLRSEARYVEEVAAGSEAALLVAMRDDLLGERRAETRHAREQRRARRVELDADFVHRRLDDLVELLSEQRLVDIVLVLPDADHLRIELH